MAIDPPYRLDPFKNIVNVQWGGLSNVCVAIGPHSTFDSPPSIFDPMIQEDNYCLLDRKTGAQIAAGKPFGSGLVNMFDVPVASYASGAQGGSGGTFALVGVYPVVGPPPSVDDQTWISAVALIDLKTGALRWATLNSYFVDPFNETVDSPGFPVYSGSPDFAGNVVGPAAPEDETIDSSGRSYAKLASSGRVWLSSPGSLNNTVYGAPSFGRDEAFVVSAGGADAASDPDNPHAIVKFSAAGARLWAFPISFDDILAFYNARPVLDADDNVWITDSAALHKIDWAAGASLGDWPIGAGAIDLDVSPSGKIVVIVGGTAYVLDPSDPTRPERTFPIVNFQSLQLRASCSGAGLTIAQSNWPNWPASLSNESWVHSYDLNSGSLVWSKKFAAQNLEIGKRPPFKAPPPPPPV